MWRNRYDDLWLWPMPGWFVRACNTTIGVYVLDLMLVSEVLGLVLVLWGDAAGVMWMRVIGYVLVAPVPILVVMMIITAQSRQRKHAGRATDRRKIERG